MSIRVLHLLDDFAPSTAASQVKLLVELLPAGEFRQTVCALGRRPGSLGRPMEPSVGESLRDSLVGLGETGLQDAFRGAFGEWGSDAHALDRRWPRDPICWGRLVGLTRRLRPHVMQSWGADAALFARRLPRAIRPTWVAWRFPGEAPSGWSGRRLARAFAAADRTVLCGLQHSAGDEGQTLHVPPGVATPERSGQRIESQIPQRIGAPAGATLVATFDSMEDARPLRFALWGLEILSALVRDVHLLVLGDGPAKSRLIGFRNTLRYWSNIHFLGAVPVAGSWLNHVDQCWAPAPPAGPSSFLLESLAAGKPTIVADSQAAQALIQHEQTGLLVPFGDRPALARAGKQMIDEPAFAERLGAAAREDVLRRFSAEAMADRYARLYRELAGSCSIGGG